MAATYISWITQEFNFLRHGQDHLQLMAVNTHNDTYNVQVQCNNIARSKLQRYFARTCGYAILNRYDFF